VETSEQGRNSAHTLIARGAMVRLVVFSVSLFALLVLVQIGIQHLAHMVVDGAMRAVVRITAELAACAIMILAYRGEVRLLERRHPDELQRAGSARLALYGVLIGTALFVTLYAILWGARVATYTSVGGVSYALTRRLWFSIGIHFGWNFTECGIFGAAVSGGHSQGFLVLALSGPNVVTAGKFGPEASAVSVGPSLITALVLGWLTVSRGRWRSFGSKASVVAGAQ